MLHFGAFHNKNYCKLYIFWLLIVLQSTSIFVLRCGACFLLLTFLVDIFMFSIYFLLYPYSMSGGYIAITLSVCLSIRSSVRLSIRSHFHNRHLSFYWKKWFYIWYMALAWWLVPCLPFPCLSHIYFLFTVRLTNERVGVFLARRSMEHLVVFAMIRKIVKRLIKFKNWQFTSS